MAWVELDRTNETQPGESRLFENGIFGKANFLKDLENSNENPWFRGEEMNSPD
jgi:hypothetical protein